jgi:5'-methylthioadenosine phosphorylase
MTACPEAFLAREAEIAYASMAHITDYDVWHETEAPVTVEMVLAQLQRNIETLQQAIALTIEGLDEATSCTCHTALDTALTTARESISPEMRERLRPLVGRVLSD